MLASAPHRRLIDLFLAEDTLEVIANPDGRVGV